MLHPLTEPEWQTNEGIAQRLNEVIALVNALLSDLAEQGYTLQRVEAVGEGQRWMVVEQ